MANVNSIVNVLWITENTFVNKIYNMNIESNTQ